MNDPVTSDDQLYGSVLHLTSGGDGIRASISDDRIVIEDRSDGHFVVINPEQAQRLHRWLSEMEKLKMSGSPDKLCDDAGQSTRPTTPEAGGSLTSNLSDELRAIADTIETNGGWHIAAVKVRAAADEVERLTHENTALLAANIGLMEDNERFLAERESHEPRAPRDADHCDYPDCEQHWTYVVAQARTILEPLAEHDPAIRQWLKTPDLPPALKSGDGQ